MAVRTHVRCHGRDQRLTLHPGGLPCGDHCFPGRMSESANERMSNQQAYRRPDMGGWSDGVRCRERLVECLVQRPLVVSG